MKMAPKTVMEKMEKLHELPWKEAQAVLAARAKLVRAHSKPEDQKPGAVLQFSNGRKYQRQADGSLRRIAGR